MSMTDELRALTLSRLTFNSPLSEARADDLVRRLRPSRTDRLLDLGCGTGELLMRLSEASGASGEGVDILPSALERARKSAETRGLEGRLQFHEADAAQWQKKADVVVCVGASHAFGGAEPAIRALKLLTNKGGTLLLGEPFWEKPPTELANARMGPLPDLPTLVDQAVAAGWRPLYVGTSTQEEFDAFESDWRAGLELSGLAEAVKLADERRAAYLRIYRGLMGFAWMVLKESV